MLSGVLLLNKDSGISSNSALLQAKRYYQAKKAGHSGTLDPLASGLLPVCFGEATKFISYLLTAPKEYIATIGLGVSTTTFDAQGSIEKIASQEQLLALDQAQIIQATSKYVGSIWQTPPIYSALKFQGKPLYKYARSAESSLTSSVVDLASLPLVKSRKVTIFSLDILDYLPPQLLKIRVRCSKGTYIRSLAHDIGNTLGVGGHLSELIRTHTSTFSLNSPYVVTLATLAGLNKEKMHALLLPVDVLVAHLPKVLLHGEEVVKVSHGNSLLLHSINMINVHDHYSATHLNNSDHAIITIGHAASMNNEANSDDMNHEENGFEVALYDSVSDHSKFLGVASIMPCMNNNDSSFLLKPRRMCKIIDSSN